MHKLKNIAFFGHKRIPSREGGVEIVVEELSTRLVNKGYDVTCFNRGGHHVSGQEFDTQKTENYKGIKIRQTKQTSIEENDKKLENFYKCACENDEKGI